MVSVFLALSSGLNANAVSIGVSTATIRSAFLLATFATNGSLSTSHAIRWTRMMVVATTAPSSVG